VHVSDNHGIIDEHLGVGDGNINWESFVQTLKANNFSGTVLVESVFNVQEAQQRLGALLR
jgi:sugar phosphate isomerase/epimerase